MVQSLAHSSHQDVLAGRCQRAGDPARPDGPDAGSQPRPPEHGQAVRDDTLMTSAVDGEGRGGTPKANKITCF